jgi:hypothetical protein
MLTAAKNTAPGGESLWAPFFVHSYSLENTRVCGYNEHGKLSVPENRSRTMPNPIYDKQRQRKNVNAVIFHSFRYQ